jgi:DNA repair protein RecO (recombination protein O)
MDVSETEAIVLSCRDYGESDRLIAFYSESAGNLRGIAKGARRSRKRFVHTFEPCSLVRLTYRVRKGLVWIEAGSLMEPHLSLRTDLVRWGYAGLVSEIILEMAPEGEAQGELFVLLRLTLEQLVTSRDPVNVVLLFLLRFLHIMGYLPSLEACGACRRPLSSATQWWWRMDRGVLACPDHCLRDEDGLQLDLGTLALIHQSRRFAVTKIWRLHFLQHRKGPLLRALLGWVRDHLRKDLKSLRLLEQLGAV